MCLIKNRRASSTKSHIHIIYRVYEKNDKNDVDNTFIIIIYNIYLCLKISEINVLKIVITNHVSNQITPKNIDIEKN